MLSSIAVWKKCVIRLPTSWEGKIVQVTLASVMSYWQVIALDQVYLPSELDVMTGDRSKPLLYMVESYYTKGIFGKDPRLE